MTLSKRKIIQPKHVLIETIARELAAVFYEVGRGQGLTSKYKNAKAYAHANLEKFIPKAIEHCIRMLGQNNLPQEAKEEIYEALMERHNDPELQTVMPNIDVVKLIEAAGIKEKETVITINTPKAEPQTVLHNPFKANRH